jgi:hypothetical protein
MFGKPKMTLEDANYSLKLECALRELGFIEIRERVLANAGIYYVRPVGFSHNAKLWEDLFGFQVEKSEEWEYHKTTGLCLGKPIIQSAKLALDLALSLS